MGCVCQKSPLERGVSVGEGVCYGVNQVRSLQCFGFYGVQRRCRCSFNVFLEYNNFTR
ncbi:hypothetical protein ES703_07515 [subsurface metagenome]